MTRRKWDEEAEDFVHIPTNHVLVSVVTVIFSGPETYIFACDEQGEVESWLELGGSTKGVLDHAEALRNAGYEIASPT
jgi:hypothetical protein